MPIKEFIDQLPRPTTQKEEVLYLLLKHRCGLTRHDFMSMAYVQNAPEAIRRLRYDHGVSIHREDYEKTNKFGRTAVFGKYVLTKTDSAFFQYKKMVSDSKSNIKIKKT